MRPSRLVISALAITVAAGAFLMSFAVETLGVPPRALAPYIQRRVLQHNPFILSAGDIASTVLLRLDRGQEPIVLEAPTRIGAHASRGLHTVALDTTPAQTNVMRVDSAEALSAAIAAAQPGTTIVLAPGRYHFKRSYIPVTRPGLADQRITVRAERLGTVVLELETAEGFLVTAPYWTFENLRIEGVCKAHSQCEHAFHVVGEAHHFEARNNLIVNFNAHVKINGQSGHFPDDGLLDGNTLTNTAVRNTDSSVTPVDLVGASRWKIRNNLITDFIKGGSDHISYGAFVKGGGADNRLEQNIVICENLLRGRPGQRVGMSLGGGGTGKAYCRDRRCITEQDRGTIEANLIASCSDDGMYINRSADSKILHNTLIDTGGIVVRFPESSAELEGNLVDGSIRSRDEGIVRAVDNIETSMTKIYLGLHPVRGLYAGATSNPFRWAEEPPRRKAVTELPADLCGATRPQRPAYGAFEDFEACLH